MPTGREKIQSAVDAARAQGRAALMICLPPGQRSAWLVAAAQACVEAGADLLELQSRFPRHPAATTRAAAEITRSVDVPVLLWTDGATIEHFVFSESQRWRLVPECLDAGVAGIVAPIRADQAQGLANSCWGELAHACFVSPDHEPQELEELCGHGAAFAYAVGVSSDPPTDVDVFEQLAGFTEQLRGSTGAPVFVGAGVATPAQAALAATFADGVAVAKAAFVALRRAHDEGRDEIDALAGLVRELRAGVTHRRA